MARTDSRVLPVQNEKEENCLTEPITDIARRFGTSINIDESLVARRRGRLFLLNENLKENAPKDFFYAGTYLGKIKEGSLIPSFNLLEMIVQENANKVFVDKRTEWLFICGRDIFKRGVTRRMGQTRKDGLVLVMNSYGECLGYGRMTDAPDREKSNVIIENCLDIGDFLRRERQIRPKGE